MLGTITQRAELLTKLKEQPKKITVKGVAAAAFALGFLIFVVLPLHTAPLQKTHPQKTIAAPCAPGETNCRATCQNLEWVAGPNRGRTSLVNETCHEHWSRWARYDFFRPNDARPTLTDEATAKARRSVDGVTAGAACCMFGGGRTVWVRDGPPLRKPELGSERSLPLSCVDYVATKFPSIDELVRSGKGSNLGSDGGKWSACTHLAVYGFNFATFFARHLAYGLRPRTVLEFGCGIGTTADFLARHVPGGSRVVCVEPEPMLADVFAHPARAGALRPVQLAMDAFDASAAPCVRDLFGGATTFDLVLSLEVAEHLSEDRVDRMVDYLAAATGQYLVFSAARPGQGGTGHIDGSSHYWQWWMRAFEKRGLRYLPELSSALRLSAGPDRGYDLYQNTFAMGAPGAVDRSDVPAEVGDWNCGIYTSAFCGQLHGPHAKPYSKKLNSEPNAQKRRAWLEGMWMALWPKLDLTIRRLKLGRERKPGGITCA